MSSQMTVIGNGARTRSMRSAGGPSRSISSTIPSSVCWAPARSRSMPRVVNAAFTALRSLP